MDFLKPFRENLWGFFGKLRQQNFVHKMPLTIQSFAPTIINFTFLLSTFAVSSRFNLNNSSSTT